MNMELANKIKRLKPAGGFIVESKKERAYVMRDAKSMRQLGLIDFEVSTHEIEPGKFKVFAL